MTVEAMHRAEGAVSGLAGIDRAAGSSPCAPATPSPSHREILEAWPSRTKPIGFVRSRLEMVNQGGETAVAIVGVSMLQRRPSTEP